MRIQVRILPNASTNEVVGKENGIYKIRLTAPPIEGRANEALIQFLADHLNTSPSRISLIKGHTSKHKTLEVLLPAEDIRLALGLSSGKTLRDG